MVRKKNIGFADKVTRILIAAEAAMLIVSGLFAEYAPLLSIIAIFAIATSFSGFCPIYSLFNINTRENRNHP